MVTDTDLCPICNLAKETTCHALWSCAVASEVWADYLSLLQKWDSAEADFRGLWERMVSVLDLQKLGEVACVLRKIWFRRHKFIFESKFDSPRVVYNNAVIEHEEYQQTQAGAVNDDNSGSGSVSANRLVRWKKPKHGGVKLN